MSTPLTYHRYTGADPPLTEEALNVTGDAVLQKLVPGLAPNATDGVTVNPGLTLIVVGADVLAQPKLFVITTR
jgi:hypothetical protein